MGSYGLLRVGKRSTSLTKPTPPHTQNKQYPQAEASNGLFSNLRAVLGEDKMLWVACPELPDLNEHRGLHRRIRNFVRERDDLVIVAVGGGSVLDLAKVMSLARSQMDFEDVFTERIAMGKRIDKLQHVPVIAVPTTGAFIGGAASFFVLYLFIYEFNHLGFTLTFIPFTTLQQRGRARKSPPGQQCGTPRRRRSGQCKDIACGQRPPSSILPSLPRARGR